jgi:integrase
VVPHSKRPTPEVMQNIPKLERKEQSIYKPTDLWTAEEDFVFYKYCPSVRDRCWHAVSRDTGCRPHELLKLKIKDVVVQQLDNGYQIARIPVNGKTGQRSVRLNNAYPRLKEWLSNGHHPYPGNPNAPLFCGVGKKSIGRRITTHAIYAAYAHYKQVVFPKVLEDPLVPEEDKRKIRDMLKKLWNPHARRHTSATEISKIIKDPILINNYFGWSQTGTTRLKYQHYFADDTIDAMLTVMDGLALPSQNEQNKKKMKDLLKPIQCPHCSETNTPESKFCVKCKFVLSFDLYNESINEAEQTKKELADLKAKQQEVIDKEEKRQYDMEDMQKELKAVQEELRGGDNGLLNRFLNHLKRYEPELAEYYENKRDKNEKMSLKEEEPKPKTWQGEAVISSYGLENYELLRTENALMEFPEKILKLYNERKREKMEEKEKKKKSS